MSLRDNITELQAHTGNHRVVYTVNSGGYDVFIDVNDNVKSPGCDYVYLVSKVREGCDSVTKSNKGWTVIEIPEDLGDSKYAHDEGMRCFLVSRDLKILVTEYFGCYEESLYIDCNVRINRDILPLWNTALHEGERRMNEIAVFKHPQRSTMQKEFDEVRYLSQRNPWERKIVHADLFDAQYEKYVSSGAFEGSARKCPLTWNNVLFRKHTAKVEATMRDWFDEITTYKQRDQLSFLYAVWKNDIVINVLPLFDPSKPAEPRNKDGAHQYPHFTLMNYYFTRPFAGAHVSTDRRIVFVKQFPQLGSNMLRGDQVAKELREYGFSCEVIEAQQGKGAFARVDEHPRLRGLSDALIFFIGKLNVEYVRYFKRDGNASRNTVVLDVVDKLCEFHDKPDKLKDIVRCADVVICPNKAAKDALQHRWGFQKLAVVIPHHWDPRFAGTVKVEPPSSDRPHFGYMGSVSTSAQNMLHMQELVKSHGLRVLDTESGEDVTEDVMRGVVNKSSNHKPYDVRSLKVGFNCHLSVRKQGSPEWLYKTDAKVATAALLDCPIVTTREQAAQEALPEDYPYFTRSDSLEDVVAALRHVEATFGGTEWHNALKMMRAARDTHDISMLVKDYVLLFDRIDQETKRAKNSP